MQVAGSFSGRIITLRSQSVATIILTLILQKERSTLPQMISDSRLSFVEPVMYDIWAS